MSYVEKGSKASLTGYIFEDRTEDYQITEKDIGNIIRIYQKRKDIFWGKYTWNPDAAKQYFLQYVAPYLLDDVWNNVIKEGHQPLYSMLNVVEVENYTADQYYFTYEIDVYFIVKHASLIELVYLVGAIILAAVTGWALQQAALLAQKLGEAIPAVIYAVKNFLEPFIPMIFMLIMVYIMIKFFEIRR